MDGTTYGVSQGSRIGRIVPSGDRLRGGDFEMWFWLVRAADDATDADAEAIDADAEAIENAEATDATKVVVKIIKDKEFTSALANRRWLNEVYVLDPAAKWPGDLQGVDLVATGNIPSENAAAYAERLEKTLEKSLDRRPKVALLQRRSPILRGSQLVYKRGR